MPLNIIYPIGRDQICINLKKGEIGQKRLKIGKWKICFLIFSKTKNMTHGTKTHIFSSYLSIYQSRTRYGRDLDSNPSKLKSLFQNEWDFLGIFAPLWHKGERRYGEEEGTLKSQKGHRSIITLNYGKFLPLLKVIKTKRK